MVAPPIAGDGRTIVHTDGEGRIRGTAAGLVVTVLAAGVAVAFASVPGSAEDPLAAIARAQGRPAQHGAVPLGTGGAPRATAFGVAFPDLAENLGWRPVGLWADTIDGRRVSTVIYERRGRRLVYSLVDGTPLPAAGRHVSVVGPVVVAIEASGRSAFAGERDGHTVVVSGVGIPEVAVIRAARAP